MNIEIRKGNLWIERNGVMMKQFCPSQDGTVYCGEWCPQFYYSENGKVYICQNKILTGDTKRTDQ